MSKLNHNKIVSEETNRILDEMEAERNGYSENRDDLLAFEAREMGRNVKEVLDYTYGAPEKEKTIDDIIEEEDTDESF